MRIFTNVIFLIAFLLIGVPASANNAVNDDCEARYDYAPYIGPIPQVGGIMFSNNSQGEFTQVSWDFGDGNYSSENSPGVVHFYSESGNYEVVLTIWNDQGCYSENSQWVEVSLTSDLCELTDCVLPGDANGDGKANTNDLLNIGLGYGAVGPARPMATLDWEPQAAPDWPQETGQGINYKHLDCNGDGIINEMDIIPLHNHDIYAPQIVEQTVEESDSPMLSLNFELDTIVIDEFTDYIHLRADVKLGSPTFMVSDIHGISFLLKYKSEFLDNSPLIELDFENNCFLGSGQEVMTMSMDNRNDDKGQVDIAISRNDGLGMSGSGIIGSVDFIIIDDIIDGIRETNGDQFPVEILVGEAIDDEGNKIQISTPDEDAKVVFVSADVVSTKTPSIDSDVKIYPQPVSDQLNVELNDLGEVRIGVFNVFGQRIQLHNTTSDLWNLDVSSFAKGVYLLNIESNKGSITKRILVE